MSLMSWTCPYGQMMNLDMLSQGRFWWVWATSVCPNQLKLESRAAQCLRTIALCSKSNLPILYRCPPGNFGLSQCLLDLQMSWKFICLMSYACRSWSYSWFVVYPFLQSYGRGDFGGFCCPDADSWSNFTYLLLIMPEILFCAWSNSCQKMLIPPKIMLNCPTGNFGHSGAVLSLQRRWNLVCKLSLPFLTCLYTQFCLWPSGSPSTPKLRFWFLGAFSAEFHCAWSLWCPECTYDFLFLIWWPGFTKISVFGRCPFFSDFSRFWRNKTLIPS